MGDISGKHFVSLHEEVKVNCLNKSLSKPQSGWKVLVIYSIALLSEPVEKYAKGVMACPDARKGLGAC